MGDLIGKQSVKGGKRTRGTIHPQGHLFCYFSPESRVPALHPLCVDVLVTDATATETSAAKAMLSRQRRKRVSPTTLGADIREPTPSGAKETMKK